MYFVCCILIEHLYFCFCFSMACFFSLRMHRIVKGLLCRRRHIGVTWRWFNCCWLILAWMSVSQIRYNVEVLLGFLFCHCKIIASVYCKFIFLIILLHGFGQDGKTALQLADGGETNEIRNLIQIHMETLPISIPLYLPRLRLHLMYLLLLFLAHKIEVGAIANHQPLTPSSKPTILPRISCSTTRTEKPVPSCANKQKHKMDEAERSYSTRTRAARALSSSASRSQGE
jgi:hypothetical protein